MKNRFLKSVLVLSTVLTLVNCSEETADAINNTDPLANQPTDEPSNLLPADEPCWLLKADQQYLIYSAGIVTDINGNVVGTIVFTEGTGKIRFRSQKLVYRKGDSYLVPAGNDDIVIEGDGECLLVTAG